MPRPTREAQLAKVHAEALAEFGGMTADPLPLERPANWTSKVEVRMAWRATVDHDPAEAWLRARIVEALAR